MGLNALLPNRVNIGGGLDAPTPPTTFAGFTEAFVDELMVESSSGVTFSTTAPTKDAGNPLFTTGTETDAWDRDKGTPCVTINGAGWHMHYLGFDTAGVFQVCYATSTDGDSWSKPNLGLVTYGGNTNNNIIIGTQAFASSAYDDPTDTWVILTDSQDGSGDANFYTSSSPSSGFTLVKTITPAAAAEAKSLVRRADGRWVFYYVAGHATQERALHAYLSDTEDVGGAYTYYGRITFPLSQDSQYYDASMWCDGSIVYSCVSRYNKTTEQIHTDLFKSTEGLHFQQIHAQWVPRGASTAWDDEMVFGQRAVTEGDEWHIYYGGSPANHAASLPRDSKIGRATIARGRAGGFGTTGSVTTYTITVADGASFTINADASGGTLDIEVQDSSGTPLTNFAEADFDTISTDVYDATPTWGGAPLPTNQTLKLKLVVSSATVYGFEFSDATPNYYDPLSAISWNDSFWADDPAWTPPADAGAVSSWRNDAGGFGDATQATGSKQPVFRRAVAPLNHRSVVGSDGGDALVTGTGTALTQPNTIVMIGYDYSSGTAAKFFVDSVSSTERNAIFRQSGGRKIFAGSTITGGTPDGAGHLHVATFNGASSVYEIDGSSDASGDAGAQDFNGVTLFNHNGQALGSNFAIAFLGVVDGTLTSGEKAELLRWAQAYYGTP